MDLNSLKYATSHEWVAMNGDTATIGITDFAVKELTDLVYIELPAVGKEIKAGAVFGQVESVKAVSDLYAPVTGTVLEFNKELPDNLAWLSENPYEKGWMIRIKVTDPGNLSNLLDKAAYDAQLH
jgi:glycine cleavage system H protein